MPITGGGGRPGFEPVATVVGGGNEKAAVELGTSARGEGAIVLGGEGAIVLGGSPDPGQRLPTGP